MSRLHAMKAIVLISALLASPLTFAKDTTPLANAIQTSQQVMSDTAITAKIKGMLVSEKVFGDKDISLLGVKVETTNGIVHLTGTVATEMQAHNAVTVARYVSGVKRVVFNLKVKPAA